MLEAVGRERRRWAIPSVAVTLETYPNFHDRDRWHRTDGDGVSACVPRQSYASPDDAGSAGNAALRAFAAAQVG